MGGVDEGTGIGAGGLSETGSGSGRVWDATVLEEGIGGGGLPESDKLAIFGFRSGIGGGRPGGMSAKYGMACLSGNDCLPPFALDSGMLFCLATFAMLLGTVDGCGA